MRLEIPFRRLLAAAFMASAGAAALAPAAANPVDPNWPCISRKVLELDAATIWDGPALDEAKEKWRNEDSVRNLSAYLISRRVKLEDVEAAIKKFASEQKDDVRDQRLTLLFAGVLARTNEERKVVMSGIERFHKRQMERAKEIEKQGLTVPQTDLMHLPETAPPATPTVGTAVPDDPKERLEWEMRVFQERQKNIPVACEIPQLIDERAGAVARAIRSEMKS